MKTIINAIFKFIAFILAGILVIALPISLLVNNLGEVLFNEEQISGIATEVIINSDIVPAALEFATNQQAEEISTKIEGTERPEGRGLNLFNLIFSMQDKDWIKFREALLAEDVITGWIEGTVQGLFAWLDSDDPVPHIVWNMDPLIQNMSDERPPGRRRRGGLLRVSTRLYGSADGGDENTTRRTSSKSKDGRGALQVVNFSPRRANSSI
jgi:hypothetical protein